MFRRLSSVSLACLIAIGAAPSALQAQVWELLPKDETRDGPVASICPLNDAETGNYFCFTLGCGDGGALHYELLYAGGAALAAGEVAVSVDGRDLGALSFALDPDGAADFSYRGAYHPEAHAELLARLRGGNRAVLGLPFPGETIERALPLRGSSRAIGAVLDVCPEPVVPLTDPGAKVLAEITRECAALGGTVDVEPGFIRRDDLDGDGTDDLVVEYVAAACSEMASLYCGSGGCTVGFYLARDDAYLGLYTGVIRGYDVEPGGILALDLHGSACGLYGYQACRKRFDVTGDELVLVEELTEAEAIAAMEAADAARGPDDPAGEMNTVPPTGGEAPDVDAPPTEDTAPEAAAPGAVDETGDEGAETEGPDADDAAVPDAGAPGEGAAETDPAAAPGAAEGAGSTPGSENPATPDHEMDAEIPGGSALIDAGPEPTLDEAAPAGTGPRLEWIGDGGPAAPPAPLEGEVLPEDLRLPTPRSSGAGKGRAPAIR